MSCELSQRQKSRSSRIKEIFLNVTGTEFFRAEAEEEKVIGFFAETGGCGVTAAAVVLSRWLALSSDKPVLYVNAGPKDDYAYYLRPTTTPIVPSSNFIPLKSVPSAIRLISSFNAEISSCKALRSTSSVYVPFADLVANSVIRLSIE